MDPIDRQGAIDAVRHVYVKFTIKSDIFFADYQDEVQEIVHNIMDAQKKALEDLPSAQPSPCEFCAHNDISDDVACLRCSAERRTDG